MKNFSILVVLGIAGTVMAPQAQAAKLAPSTAQNTAAPAPSLAPLPDGLDVRKDTAEQRARGRGFRSGRGFRGRGFRGRGFRGRGFSNRGFRGFRGRGFNRGFRGRGFRGRGFRGRGFDRGFRSFRGRGFNRGFRGRGFRSFRGRGFRGRGFRGRGFRRGFGFGGGVFHSSGLFAGCTFYSYYGGYFCPGFGWRY